MTKSRPRYRGKLNKPLSLLPEIAHPLVKPAPDIVAGRKAEVAERLALLLLDHCVQLDDPDHWYKLALSLACQHVRGFRVETRGKESEWPYKRQRQLYQDVMARKKGLSEEARCIYLAKTDERYKKFKPKTLLRQFQEDKVLFDLIEEYVIPEAKEAGRAKGRYAEPVLSMDRDAVYAPISGAVADEMIRPFLEKMVLEATSEAVSAIRKKAP